MEGVTVPVLTDQGLAARFIRDCKIRGLTERTIEDYVSCVNIFTAFIHTKGVGLLEITKDIVKEFVEHLRFEREVTDKRIKNYFSALSTLYEYLIYEEWFDRNIILDMRKRYLRSYKAQDNGGSQRKLIDVDTMASFINSIMDIRDKAMALLFAKTGIRRKELINIDLEDIDWKERSITLKPTAKRSNRVVYFDDETALILQKWIRKRETIADPDSRALFVSYLTKRRLKRNGVYTAFTHWAERAGLHDPDSDRLEDHFTPHCCRHWFTTHLRRAGMPREYIKELRGDARTEAMDIYHHIDREELKKSYLAHIPQLGVE